MKKAFLGLGVLIVCHLSLQSIHANTQRGALKNVKGDESRYQLHFSSGIAAINRLDFLNAVKEFESALKEKPSDPESLFYLGYSYNRFGKQKKAIPILDHLVRENPANTGAREELGIAYYYAGNYHEALQILDKVRDEQPENAQTSYYIGLTHLVMGDFARAEESISKAASSNVSYGQQGHYKMGLAYLERNRKDEAIEQLELAHQLLPESEEGIEAIGLAQGLRQGKRQGRIWAEVQARYEYDSNVVLMPDNGDIVNISGKDDFRYSTTFTLNYNQPLTKFVELDGRYRFTQSVHQQIGDYNLLGNDLLNGLRFNIPHASPWVGYRYEYYFLDDCKQSYLRSNTVVTNFTIPETNRAFTIPYYNFRKDDFMLPYYYDEDNRDAYNHTVGGDQYFLITRDGRTWARCGVAYDRNNARGINYFYDGMKISGEFSTPLACELFLDAEAEYYIRNYCQSVYHRYDDQQNYVITLARRINRFMELGFQYELVVNDSTVGLFQYNRNIFSLLAIARF